jgi:ribosomal protein S18 acetylase RimI-like enzyme
MSEIKIREFQFPADYQSVHDLWSSIERGVHVGRSDTPIEIERKISRDPDLFLVAECQNKIIGSVIGGYDGRRGLIYHLAVSEKFRGQGIGSHLMDEVESRLRAKGCLKCYLLVLLITRKRKAIIVIAAGITWTRSAYLEKN